MKGSALLVSEGRMNVLLLQKSRAENNFISHADSIQRR
jgi:hypothetical protein